MMNSLRYVVILVGISFVAPTRQSHAQDIDPGYYYRLTTQWQGDGKSLDIINDQNNNNQPWLNDTKNWTSQFWKFTPLGNGFYRLTTRWQGDDKSLDIVNDGKSNDKPILAKTGNYSGQYWKVTALGNGYFRLTTSWQGDGKSLDIINDGKNNNRPILAKTGNYTGQFWKLTKLQPIEGSESAGATRSAKTNLAYKKFCSTSSRSQWSSDEQGAVDGIKNGGFGFHTGPGPAWWQVDLGTDCQLDNVLIFNRTDCCSERARTIQVLLSSDGQNFSLAYNHDGSVFGGVSDGKPLNVPLNGANARYVRLQITSGDMFHLDEVEVYGVPMERKLENLAFRKFCSTSSRSQWSNDEQGAVDGIKNGGFGFHTDPGPAWWQVDLGSASQLQNVLIFNRMDCCAERARTLQVLLSLDGQHFDLVYNHDGSIFGGARDGRPLNVPLNGATARFVRLQITTGDFFHLDEVEVYGYGTHANGENTVMAGGSGVIDEKSEGKKHGTRDAIQTVLDYSKYKLNLPSQITMLLALAGVSEDDTDFACSVLGTAAYVIQSAQSISISKRDVQELLQKVQQLKVKKLQKIPFFKKLIEDGERDLSKMLRKMK